jgi:hypothetical protein
MSAFAFLGQSSAWANPASWAGHWSRALTPGGGGSLSGALRQQASNAGYAPGAPAQQAQFVSAGESKVKRDAEGETAQRDALKRMRGIADTGYSDIDRAAMSQAQKSASATNKSMSDSVLRNAQRRGTAASSGGDLTAALVGAQGSADRLSQETQDINARGQERRTQATGAMSDMGGGLTAQEMAIGQAQNQQNQFNAGQQNQVNIANAGYGNTNQNIQYQGANTMLGQQSALQSAANAANVGYNQQMLSQFTRPVLGSFGRMMG